MVYSIALTTSAVGGRVQPPAVPVERVTMFPDEPKSAAPLLIEWQGDRYVRRTSASTTGSRESQPDYVADKSVLVTTTKTARSLKVQSQGDRPSNPELPPTAFILPAMGHREESDNYSIISGVIYARRLLGDRAMVEADQALATGPACHHQSEPATGNHVPSPVSSQRGDHAPVDAVMMMVAAPLSASLRRNG